MSKNSSLNNENPVVKTTNLLGVISSVLSSAIAFFVSPYIVFFAMFFMLALLGNDNEAIKDIFLNNLSAKLLASFLVAAVSIKILLLFIKKQKLDTKKVFFLENKPSLNNFVDVFITYGLYFLVMIAVTIAADLLTPININQAQELGIARPEDFSEKLQVFLMIVILPPVYEELLFRGYLFSTLSKYTTKVIAVAITCILFGIAHLEYDNLNWIAAVDTMVFSGFLIYISQKHKSIYSSILMHSIKNCIAFYVLFVRL
jgi:membrane protease YdiL (CAAX protease family)